MEYNLFEQENDNQGEFYLEQIELNTDSGSTDDERKLWSTSIYKAVDEHYGFNDELVSKVFGEESTYQIRHTENIFNKPVRKFLDCECFVDNQFFIKIKNEKALHPTPYWNQYKVFNFEQKYNLEWLKVPISMEKNGRGLELYNLIHLNFYTWIVICKRTGVVLDYIIIREPFKLYEHWLNRKLNANPIQYNNGKKVLEILVNQPLFQELIVVRKGMPFIGIVN